MPFKTLKTELPNGDIYRIKLCNNRFMVTLEPEFSYNGAQCYDGRFPRSCESLRGAKSAVTKWLGFKPNWIEE